MPRDPSFEPFRTFYREGGYVSAPAAEKPSRMQEIEMALWGSQHYADGGKIGDDGLPHFGGGGAQIMRKGFEPAMQAVMEYLGGLKRNPIQLPDTGYGTNKLFQEKWPKSTAPLETGHSWTGAVREGIFPYESLFDTHPEDITRAMRRYTSSDYSDFNNTYRKFAENQFKIQDATTPYGKRWWETGNVHPYEDDVDQILRGSSEMDIAKQARDLGKYLQDREVELPYDIYRGARFRLNPEELMVGDAPELHGRGLGSFSFNPKVGVDFGTDTPNFYDKEYYSGSHKPIYKIPSAVRIPQGTKVRGANIAPYSEMDSEFEFLMAPFQGFDVTDINLLERPDIYRYNQGKPYQKLLLDAVPSNSYNPTSPAIYADGGEVEGYADGGLASVFSPKAQNAVLDALQESLAPAPMAAPLPMFLPTFGSANAATGNVSGTIGGPGVSSESAVGDAGATGGVGGSESSDAGVGGSAAAGIGGDDGGTYEDGGYLRHLMTGYSGEFYNDGGVVHTLNALNKLRGLR